MVVPSTATTMVSDGPAGQRGHQRVRQHWAPVHVQRTPRHVGQQRQRQPLQHAHHGLVVDPPAAAHRPGRTAAHTAVRRVARDELERVAITNHVGGDVQRVGQHQQRHQQHGQPLGITRHRLAVGRAGDPADAR